jgi:hypothetical protein
MGQAIPTQHPAVVLRSHYTNLRALLAIAMIAVVGLTVAVVMLATSDGAHTTAIPVAASRGNAVSTVFRVPPFAGEHGGAPVPDVRFAPLPNARRFDGGPDEGSRGVVITQAPGSRSDGGPEEGSRGLGH